MGGVNASSDAVPARVLTMVGLLGLSAMAALLIKAPSVYRAIVDGMSFGALPMPFIDSVYILAQAECWRRGVDVYAFNPCDPLGRLQDYSPLWLRIPGFVTTVPMIVAVGVGQAMVFLLSLSALPKMRRETLLVMVAALASPVTVFALERGNPDLSMFVLAVLAAVLAPRRPFAAGAVILLAGLLKFYPLVLLILLLRARRAVTLIAWVTAAFGIFVLLNWGEILRMLPNVPRPSSFIDAFGAVQVTAGLGELFGAPTGVVGVVTPVLLLAAGGLAVRLSMSMPFALAFRALSEREQVLLVAGSASMAGCFLVGNSTAYREIHLLLALPGLTAMNEKGGTGGLRPVLLAVGVGLGLLWVLPLGRLVYGTFGYLGPHLVSPPSLAFWLLREWAWWGLMVVLGAAVLRYAMDSPLVQACLGRMRRTERFAIAGATSRGPRRANTPGPLH